MATGTVVFAVFLIAFAIVHDTVSAGDDCPAICDRLRQPGQPCNPAPTHCPHGQELKDGTCNCCKQCVEELKKGTLNCWSTAHTTWVPNTECEPGTTCQQIGPNGSWMCA